MTLGERIKQLRKIYGFSQTDLARKSGLSRTYLYRVEIDTSNITVQNLYRIAKAFELSLPDVLAPVDFTPETPANGYADEPLPFEDVQS